MQQFIAGLGPLAVFLLMVAESACIPIPSEVIMLLGGALAGGAIPGTHPSLVLVIVAGVLGNVVGSYIAWAVGRYAGQAALHRWGRFLLLRDGDIEKAHRWFTRYGAASVFFGRMLPVIRTFISLPAGFAAMPPVRFGVYTLLGCIPWTAALGIAGYAIGANWQTVADDFHGPTYIVAAVVGIGIIVAIVLFVRKRRAARAEQS
ncbi:MAG TPA: DedA family protein [Pseudonocardiaceae bacterium]|jgi:membrane protein DedA with SNARE-associated domain